MQAQNNPPTVSNMRSNSSDSTHGTSAKTTNSPLTPIRIIRFLPNLPPSHPLGMANTTKASEKRQEKEACDSVSPISFSRTK